MLACPCVPKPSPGVTRSSLITRRERKPWWAHLEFTRINIAPTILRKKIEERRVLCAFASMGECPVAVLWVRRSETNRPFKCLEDTRRELVRKGLTHRRMANDSPKIKWSCQRVNEQVGVSVPRQFSGRDGLLDQVPIHGASRQIETFEE